MRSPMPQRAVVVGGSVAGLAAAAALAPRSEQVVIVERRPLPRPEAEARSIAPQGGFPHTLLASGAAALERLVPGLIDDLLAGGAPEVDGVHPLPVHWWAAGSVRRSVPPLGVRGAMASRDLVEHRLRAAVLALPNVTAMAGTVRGLRLKDGRVQAVMVEGQEGEVLEADLVVDAAGRGSRAPEWLRQAGFPAPEVSRVEVGITYTALQLRRSPGDLDGALLAVVQNSPTLARLGIALPMEGDRWNLLLAGYFGDAAPTDPEGLRGFARSLPDPAIAELLEHEWLTEPARHRFPFSQRRHWEGLQRSPAGLCVIGDAVASFNPIYGQGMSSAALQAEALGAQLDRLGNGPRLPAAVAKAAARIVDTPWQIAAGGDFIYPETTGARLRGTALVNRYLARMMRAASGDEVLNRALVRVQHLLAPPSSLLAPNLLVRTLRPLPAATSHAPGETVPVTPG